MATLPGEVVGANELAFDDTLTRAITSLIDGILSFSGYEGDDDIQKLRLPSVSRQVSDKKQR